MFLAFALTSCATPVAGAAPAPPYLISAPTETPDPAAPSDSEITAAREQAQIWLDAANLPPGAIRSEETIGGFTSYTGWPCGPVEELEAFWTIPGATVSDTANWLREHPTADLITTAFAPVTDDPAIDSAMIGYIPAPDSQEGIVYTIARKGDGVAVRAEIAAQTESAVCPPLPDGGMYGAPGQG
ncbi:hypothetical protein J2Y46_002358 [Microbacterium sp. BE35]|uniref:hypothetical protein n=1 Tax=Microbacterium sp. BE35 TaxID=2817773 RepID=UPI00286769A0|nr:hypothetical protein [Microbacterium sp. BE35]MDR7189532.1 hypothetical protein [Microbacterium sp. BE35]